MHIVETIQKNLGFSVLEKIDPNTQQAPGQDFSLGNNALAQAGIPAILLGIFQRLEDNPDIASLDPGLPGSLLERIFGKSTEDFVKQIEQYSKIQNKHGVQELEHISAESIRVIREKIGDKASERAVRRFVANQKPEILFYLPPSLELGAVLRNNHLDDRTGKMTGPLSSFLHRMESAFNSSGKN